jgi:hypothetical protein
MKISRIAFAAAAACGMAAPAFAVTANNYTNTGEFQGTTLNIRIAGASAQDNGVLGSALSLCQAGTVHRYATSNNYVFYCTPDAGTNTGQIQIPTRSASNGGPINKLAIYKYAVGGSAFGVIPLNSNSVSDGSTGGNGAQLPFLDLAKLNTLCTGANATTSVATFGSTAGSPTYNNVACATSLAVTTPAVAYIGLSDVEPQFFTPNVGNLESTAVTSLIFAPVVTKNVYDRLQVLQGTGTGDAEANMPTLTSAQLVTLYTQPGQAWSSLGVSGLGNDQVYIARRIDTSGTQKTFEALIARTTNGDINGKSCQLNTDIFAQPDSGTTTGDNESVCLTTGSLPTVFAGNGGGNLRNCLTNHQAGGRSAIGILTTEDKPNGSWRFVKVDGVAPNQANVANGKYRFYTENVLITRKSGALATNSAEGYANLVQRLISDFSKKEIIKSINGGDQSFGAAGLMALLSRQGSATDPADQVPDFTGARSINPWTKVVGSESNNCQAPKLFN